MVLQETILSPRTVHFSKEQMFWQCRTCALGEGDVENVEFNYWPSYDFQNNKAFLSNRLPDWTDMQQRSGDGWIQRPEFYSIQTQWLRIVNEYCKRLLTYESDTLPALSGCATSFCSFTKDMYLAGIWLSDLSRGLLLSTEDSKPSRSYQAPSWSWASRNWMTNAKAGLLFMPPYFSLLVASKFPQDYLTDVRFCSQNLQLKTTDTFGELCEGSSITVSGQYANVRKWKIMDESSSLILAPPTHQSPENKLDHLELSLGSQREWEEELYVCLSVTCLAEYGEGSSRYDEAKTYRACILRRRHHSPNEFIRVGTTRFGSAVAMFRQGWDTMTMTIY
jgi:hypothetical protein